MNEIALREKICEIGRRLCDRNLVSASDGNISARLERDRYLCTPSGVSKGDMRPEMLLIADGNGGKLEGDGKVTSEFFTHLAAYEERPDIEAVIHAHPPMSTACTLAGLSLTDPVLPDLVMAMGGVPVAPYATPGSREGAEAIREMIRLCDTVLLDRHGAVSVGKSLAEAWFKMDKLEHCAATLLAARQVSELSPLSPEQIRRLLDSRTAYGVSWRCYPI